MTYKFLPEAEIDSDEWSTVADQNVRKIENGNLYAIFTKR